MQAIVPPRERTSATRDAVPIPTRLCGVGASRRPSIDSDPDVHGVTSELDLLSAPVLREHLVSLASSAAPAHRPTCCWKGGARRGCPWDQGGRARPDARAGRDVQARSRRAHQPREDAPSTSVRRQRAQPLVHKPAPPDRCSRHARSVRRRSNRPLVAAAGPAGGGQDQRFRRADVTS